MIAVVPMMLRVLGAALVAGLLWLGLALDLAPLTGQALSWPMPDLMMACAFCLVLRRPSLLPPLAVFGAGLLHDLLAGGAVGPGALGLLAATEYLRGAGRSLRRRGLLAEWLAAAAMAALALVIPAAMLWVSLDDVPARSVLLGRWLATALSYPLLVAVLRVGREREAFEAPLRQRGA